MEGNMSKTEEKVIDSEHWLKTRADRLFAEGDTQAATYYRRLLDATQDPKLKEHIHTRLGLIAHREGNYPGAAREFEIASEFNPQNPEISQAIARLSLLQGRRWEAFYHAVKAIYLSRADRPELLPTLAQSLAALDNKDLALTTLLGGLERYPDHPFLLEALGRLYETMERWIDAIETRDTLIELLKHELASQDHPELLLPTSPFDIQRSRKAQEAANFKLRQGLQLADSETFEGEYALAKLQNPPGLHTLITRLNTKPRAAEHLHLAQSIWARAVDQRLDVHLNAYTLAASVEWITLKMHWAPLPEPDTWETVYSIGHDRVKAAVRLIVSALDIDLLPLDSASRYLERKRVLELKNMGLALILDVDVSTLTPSRMLL